MLGKGSGAIPSFSSVCNNKSLTFARRKAAQTSLVGGNQIFFEYWWARSPSAQTGLQAVFNWAAACQADRGEAVIMEVRGVQDWNAPFDRYDAQTGNYMHASVAGAWPSLSLPKTRADAFRFGYWFSKYTGAAGIPTGFQTVVYNGNTSSSYYRRGLAHSLATTNPISGTYPSATSYAVMALGDCINGDAPPKARPPVVCTG
jgi:hypothetical protein